DRRVLPLADTRASDAGDLIERSEQLSLLRDRLAAVRDSSSGRVVLVSGEAGVGKTALLRRFCGDPRSGSRVLWAACDPLFTPRPLGPLLDVAGVTEGQFRVQVERGAKPHDVAAALLDELRLSAPTVLVLEDLHWADEATLDVVRLIARRADTVPALLVVSYRDDQLERSHPLQIVLGELPTGAVVTPVGLAGLSRQAVLSLAKATRVDGDELFDKTAGNPFFVTEVLAAGAAGVPSTVRDAVLARAARLTPSARALLDAVAVVPQKTELWLLEALVDRPEGSVEDCLRSGMLSADVDGVSFRHELARL